jgi:hypothetical protein
MRNELTVQFDWTKVTMPEVTAPKQVANYNYSYDYAKRNNCDDIYKAYGRPSWRKVRAWEYCNKFCNALDGWNLFITGASCHFFTAMFEFVNPETGVCSLCRISAYGETYCDRHEREV